MNIEISDDWLPTADNINALPMPLRRYIHDIETKWDPAHTVQELAAARDLIAQLEAAVVLGRVFGR